ncbi:MAG: hypothetical protein AB8E82_15420 [Aureispira sp.]
MMDLRNTKIAFLIGVLFAWSCCLVSCTVQSNDSEQSEIHEPWQAGALVAVESTADAPVPEEMTIAMPLSHEIRLIRRQDEQQQAKLSEANVKELESWWDSLPKPVQSQIKSKEIDIEVFSKIRTNDKKVINPQLNDSQIENTGEALEQIIGSQTGMTYTVSTTLIENKATGVEQEHATNIRLVKQMPVKLQQFDTEIFLREEQVNNDNIQSLQYWWTHLPEDVQNKIKSREIVVDVNYHRLATVEGAEEAALQLGEGYTAVMGDVLQRLIGVYKVGNKEYALAKVASTFKVDQSTANNADLPAPHYIKIGLRKNKDLVPAPM